MWAFLVENELTDKIVVITGGSQGIGRQIAIAFAKLKSRVIICSRTKKDLEVVAKEIKSFGGHCENFTADVSNHSHVRRLFDKVIDMYGGLDILINCAGIYGPIGPFDENDAEEWENTMAINLLGTVNAVRCAIPVMKKQRHGKIITFCGGGIGGPSIKPNLSAYTTSKFAIAGFTEAIAKEVKDFDIQINAISPGAVNTRLLDQILKAGEIAGKDFLKECKKQKMEGGTPPEKIAGLVIFLASKQSDYITGKVISVVWDEYKNFYNIRDRLNSTSLYNLRRIDDFAFFEKTK